VLPEALHELQGHLPHPPRGSLMPPKWRSHITMAALIMGVRRASTVDTMKHCKSSMGNNMAVQQSNAVKWTAGVQGQTTMGVRRVSTVDTMKDCGGIRRKTTMTLQQSNAVMEQIQAARRWRCHRPIWQQDKHSKQDQHNNCHGQHWVLCLP